MKQTIKCDWCGRVITRYTCRLKERNYCCRACVLEARSKKTNPNGYQRNFNAGHLVELNRRMNPGRMIPEVREKLRKARLGTGEGKSYTKRYGRHEHRVVAEQILGRPLRKGEVVHHIDGNKRNNLPENLMVFESQTQHAKFHQMQKKEVIL